MEKTGRHKTLDKELKRSVEWLKTFDFVAKVVISISESCRHRYAPGTIRWKMDAPGGITANGYSGKGVTNLFIKVEPIEQRPHLKNLLNERFRSE